MVTDTQKAVDRLQENLMKKILSYDSLEDRQVMLYSSKLTRETDEFFTFLKKPIIINKSQS